MLLSSIEASQYNKINNDLKQPIMQVGSLRLNVTIRLAEPKVDEIESSFIEEILCAPLLPKFELPPITMFNGVGVPVECVNSFHELMDLHEVNHYRVFSFILSTEAIKWFRKLSLRFIGSFSQLNQLFISQIVGEKTLKKSTTHPLLAN